jgi:hypothetical protein
MDETTSCADCGAVPAPERPAVLWSMTQADGRRAYVCSPCARAAVACIESGVDLSAWFDAA